MKLLLIFATGILAVNTFDFDKNDSRIHGANGWYVPLENNTFFWMSKDEFESIENSRGVTLTPVKFYLYTKSTPNKGTHITDSAKSIRKSNFNPKYKTKFIIHGFIQGRLSSMNKEIRKGIFSQGKCNVIVVDWARGRSMDYVSSVLAVPKVGEKVADMIKTLMLHGMSLKDTTLIGYSLGAHVAGMAGKNILKGQIDSIYGLEPALPLYDYNKPDKRLNRNDARYVETIHTNGGGFGFLLSIGKSSFYPNGGQYQPGCLTSKCSHERVTSYFAESLELDNFGSIQCESLENAVAKTCGEAYSSVRMGAAINSLAVSGIYNVPVNKKSPFGNMQ